MVFKIILSILENEKEILAKMDTRRDSRIGKGVLLEHYVSCKSSNKECR